MSEYVFQNETEITFGRRSRRSYGVLDDYGMMLYHRNRLITPYVKLGCQTKVQVSAFFWQLVSAFFWGRSGAVRPRYKPLPFCVDLPGLSEQCTSLCLLLRT